MARPMKVFVAQPMRGRGRGEIEDERQAILADAPDILGVPEVEEVPSFFSQKTVEQMHPLYCLGMSLQLLSASEAAIFAPGWEEARGCRIEHECAVQYGIRVIDLSDGQIEGAVE